MAFIRPGTQIRAQRATVSGSSNRTVVGTGAIAAQSAQLVGDGEVRFSGTGVLTAQAASIAGIGGRAPVWTSIPNPVFVEGVPGSYDLKNDIDDDFLAGVTFTLSNEVGLGAGLGFSSDGVINYSGVGSPSTSGHTSTASDLVGQDTSAAFDVVVTAQVGILTQVQETPEQIAVVAPVLSLNTNYVATVRYRLDGTTTWLTAHPLHRSEPQTGNDKFSGVIFDLLPGQTYEIEVTYTDGITPIVQGTGNHGTFTTRALPPNVAQQTPDVTVSSLGAADGHRQCATAGHGAVHHPA